MVRNVQGGLGRVALSGLLWGIAGTAVGKLASVVAQLVLGWMLSKSDFGIYAVATVCATFFSGLANGGTQRVLIQRGTAQYNRIGSPVLQLSTIFNLGMFLLILATAWPLTSLYRSRETAPLLVLMGLATLIATPGNVFTARLSMQLKFARVQGLATCSHVLRHGSTILFAFLGMGPLSFVLPIVLTAVTDNVLGWWAAGGFPPWKRLSGSTAGDILRDSRWVMIGTFSGGLIANGSNLAVGLIVNRETLGVYFFAYQLTLSIAHLMGGTLQSVLVPALVRASNTPQLQRQFFINSLSCVVAVSALAASMGALSAPWIVNLLWSGKWNETIPIVQILCLAIPAQLAIWISAATIEAEGGWSTVTWLAILEGVAIVLATIGGALSRNLSTVAVMVVCVKVVSCLLHAAAAARTMTVDFRSISAALLAPYAMGALALFGSWMVVLRATSGVLKTLGETSTAIVVFMVIFAALCFRLYPRALAEGRRLFRSLRDSA